MTTQSAIDRSNHYTAVRNARQTHANACEEASAALDATVGELMDDFNASQREAYRVKMNSLSSPLQHSELDREVNAQYDAIMSSARDTYYRAALDAHQAYASACAAALDEFVKTI